MAALDRIVNVNITLAESPVQSQPFDTILVLAQDERLTDRVHYVTSVDDLLEIDGSILPEDPIYGMVRTAFRQENPPEFLYLGRWGDLETAADALDACNDYTSKTAGFERFYGVVTTSRDIGDILAIAEWVEDHDRFFLSVTDDPVAPTSDTDDDISLQVAGDYFRTVPLFHTKAATEFLDVALMVDRFHYTPGNEGWALASLRDVTPDSFSNPERNFLQGKNATTFEAFRNKSVTQGGKVAAGEWADIIRYIDYLAESIRVDTSTVLIRRANGPMRGKTPFTDSGISIIESTLRATLQRQVGAGLAEPERDSDGNEVPSFEVTVPRSLDIRDKHTRKLKDVFFSARIEGAIYATDIKGYLE